MGLPTCEKEWQFDVNRTVWETYTDGDSDLAIRRAFLTVTAALKGFAESPWVVIGSSDSVAAALDASDRLTDPDDLVASSSGVHSWLVLRQPGSGGSLCFDFNASDVTTMTIVFSPSAGFTGGSTSARPTATDQSTILASGGLTWFGSALPQYNFVIHVLHSTDGCNTVILCGYRIFDNYSALIIGNVGDASAGWTTECVATLLNSADLADDLWGNVFAARGPSGTISLTATAEAVSVGDEVRTKQTGKSDFDGSWPMTPVGFVSTTSGASGRLGRLVDVWTGTTQAPVGATYPLDATRQFIHFGNLIFPWNGTIPRLG